MRDTISKPSQAAVVANRLKFSAEVPPAAPAVEAMPAFGPAAYAAPVAVSPTAAPGIRPLAVTGRLTETARRFANQVNPQSDLAAISDVGENFLAAHGAKNLTPAAAQELKTGTYKALSSRSYGEVKGATIEAEKALARGLKEEIEREAAQAGINIGAMNAREGAAITARDEIAKRLAQVGNRDPGGLAWLAHSPTTFLVSIMQRGPAVKSLIARGMYHAASQYAKVPADAIRLAVSAVASDAAQEPQ